MTKSNNQASTAMCNSNVTDQFSKMSDFLVMEQKVASSLANIRNTISSTAEEIINGIKSNPSIIAGKDYYEVSSKETWVGSLDKDMMDFMIQPSGELKSFDEIVIVGYADLIDDILAQFNEVETMKTNADWELFNKYFASEENKNAFYLVLTSGNSDYHNGMGRLHFNMRNRIVVKLN